MIESEQLEIPLEELSDRVRAALSVLTIEELRQLVAEMENDLFRPNESVGTIKLS